MASPDAGHHHQRFRPCRRRSPGTGTAGIDARHHADHRAEEFHRLALDTVTAPQRAHPAEQRFGSSRTRYGTFPRLTPSLADYRRRTGITGFLGPVAYTSSMTIALRQATQIADQDRYRCRK